MSKLRMTKEEMNKIRMSNELPDDVGSVFITDVPGSWCQLMGRRAYGQLWIGRAIVPSKGQASPATDVATAPARVEIVRGPEAKALLEVFDELHGERIWQDALMDGVEPAIARPEKRTRQ